MIYVVMVRDSNPPQYLANRGGLTEELSESRRWDNPESQREVIEALNSLEYLQWQGRVHSELRD